MFPSACPLLQPHYEALEGLGRAAECKGSNCPWFEEECRCASRSQLLKTERDDEEGSPQRDPTSSR